ncbi:MAG: CotH kinase family protein [Bacteroidia bacterium]
MKKNLSQLTVACCLIIPATIAAQSLPLEIQYSNDGKMLVTGKSGPEGFYDSTIIRSLYLDFSQSNYWSQLTANYQTRTPIPATLTIDGVVMDSVGVGFKGNTSYMSTGQSQKKSFSIKTDEYIDGQDFMGYSNYNLNNAAGDPSFLREVFYLHQIRKHVPAAKANFVHLYLNNQDWGIYPNIQQLNKDFLEQWFFSNDGANFRATVRSTGGPGGPGGGGGGWGDGTAAFNYLGNDTATYQQYYTLISSDIEDGWQRLITACNMLNNTPSADLKTVLPQYFDIDRVLWFLASEIAFSDDDSYVMKGKMDYYAYFDPETERFTPIEFDGNSVMESSALNWSPFYHADNVNYPLLNIILNVPEWRQRYLAHLRTIISEELNPTQTALMLDNYKTQINDLVNADPKKLYTYAQFLTEVMNRLD